MTWWQTLLVAYGASFVCGVGCYEDGPTPEFFTDWLFMGTVIAGALFLGGAVA